MFRVVGRVVRWSNRREWFALGGCNTLALFLEMLDCYSGKISCVSLKLWCDCGPSFDNRVDKAVAHKTLKIFDTFLYRLNTYSEVCAVVCRTLIDVLYPCSTCWPFLVMRADLWVKWASQPMFVNEAIRRSWCVGLGLSSMETGTVSSLKVTRTGGESRWTVWVGDC